MLTAKQHQTLEFICHYETQYGYAPTVAEIAEGIAIRSRGVTYRYIKALEDAGYIECIPNKRRNIKILKHLSVLQGLPIIGKIAAGAPIEAIEQQNLINFNESLIGPNRFILEVKGDSMIGDHICNGDFIICEKRCEVKSHEIAVVLIDNTEATLKRVQRNGNGTVSLLASNPDIETMTFRPEQIHIQGVYLGLLRF